MTTNALTLAGALWPAAGGARLRRAALALGVRRDAALARGVRYAALALGGTILLALSAKAQIPFWPVPFTMQTFAVLILGMAYGSRLAGATLLLYLAEGAVGLPVFATGGGLAYFAGPTGGYLLGFAPAAMLMGLLAERGWGRSAATTVLAMLAGVAVIFVCGVSWLGYLIGFDKAIAAGLLPFVPGEAVKIAAATVLMPVCWRLIGKPDAPSDAA